MSDLSSGDIDLDAARVAFGSGIDGVAAAVQEAIAGINEQIDRLEGVRDRLEAKLAAVDAEIDGLADRAGQLEALTLPTSVEGATGTTASLDDIGTDDGEAADETMARTEEVHAAAEAAVDARAELHARATPDEPEPQDPIDEVVEVIEYVDEDGNPVDEHGNPLEVTYVDEDGNEVVELIEYVDEDGNPVDEHGNPLEVEYVDEDGNPVDEHGNPLEVEYEEVEYVEEIALDDAVWADLELPRTDRLVALVEFHGEITTAEAVEALAEVGDEVSTSTVSASLGNLARQGRISKLDAGLFGSA